MNDECLKTIEKSAAQYSFGGDRTLEYIGIEYSANGAVSCKVYLCSRNQFNMGSGSVPANVRIFHEDLLKKSPDLQFVDYSFRDTDCYSLSYNCIGSEGLYFDSMAAVIHERLGLSENPLFQVGFLLDKNAAVLERKYYYNLFKGNDKPSGKYKFEYVENNTAKFLSLFNALFPRTDSFTLENVFSTSLRCLYYPFLVGSNVRGESVELKQYFILNRIMNREEANANFFAFIHNFITDGRLDDIVKTCNDNLLYLRGYAVSFDDNTCDWRFYFYPLKY